VIRACRLSRCRVCTSWRRRLCGCCGHGGYSRVRSRIRKPHGKIARTRSGAAMKTMISAWMMPIRSIDTPGIDLHLSAAGFQRAEQQPGEQRLRSDASGRAARRRWHRKPMPAEKPGVARPRTPRTWLAPARPASAPAVAMASDDDQRGAHAGIARRIGLFAAGAELEAGLGAEQQPLHDDHREKHRKMPACTRRLGSIHSSRRGSSALRRHRLGYRVCAALLLDKVVAQQIVEQAVGDQIEHDRRDHLMRTGRRPQPAGDRGVEGAAQGRPPATTSGMRMKKGRPGKLNRRSPPPAAHQDLALRADVEQAGAEAERQPEPGKHQRGGAVSVSDRALSEPTDPVASAT
jgi:hypothetical protein